MFALDHGQQAGGNRARFSELAQLLQFGLVHLAAVAADAAPRVEVLAAQAAGDGHVVHLDVEFMQDIFQILQNSQSYVTCFSYLFHEKVGPH